jgi:hypothetical protein
MKKIGSHWKRERESLKRMNIHMKEKFGNVASMNEDYVELLEDILGMKNLWTLKICRRPRLSQLMWTMCRNV